MPGKRTQPRRHCLFCDRTNLTEEHFFGKWYFRTLDKRKRLIKRYHTVDFRSAAGVTVKTFSQNGDPRQEQLKVVCRECNGTWMSALQTKAKELTKFMEDGGRTLSAEDCLALANYAVMFATVLGQKHPHLSFPSFEICDAFRRIQIPVGEWVVWIGLYDSHMFNGFNHFGLRAGSKGTDGNKILSEEGAQCTTWIIRNVLFVAYYKSQFMPEKLANPDFDLPIPRIWPAPEGGIQLPDFVLDDVGADRISRQVLRRPEDQTRRAWDIGTGVLDPVVDPDEVKPDLTILWFH